MIATRITELFGIEYPIVSAGMGGIALARLAAAVSEAGGLGTIALAGFTPEAIHQGINAGRTLPPKPVAGNLLRTLLRAGNVQAGVGGPVPAGTRLLGD